MTYDPRKVGTSNPPPPPPPPPPPAEKDGKRKGERRGFVIFRFFSPSFGKPEVKGYGRPGFAIHPSSAASWGKAAGDSDKVVPRTFGVASHAELSVWTFDKFVMRGTWVLFHSRYFSAAPQPTRADRVTRMPVPRTLFQYVCTRRRNCIEQLSPFS